MKTSIVTGGAGFLGSHLVDALVKRGEFVVIFDNLSTGRLANLEAAISSGRVTFVYSDVAVDRAALSVNLRSSGAKRVDNIYHLASPASADTVLARPWEALAVNALGTMSLIDIALEHQARLIFSSTSEVYADSFHVQSEGTLGNQGFTAPPSWYGEGKRFGEAAIAAAVAKRGLDGRIVRLFECYGPRMRETDEILIPALYNAVANRQPLPVVTGQQKCSFTYVDDAVEMLLIVANGQAMTLQPIDVGSDDERSVTEIAKLLAGILRVDFLPDFRIEHSSEPERRRPNLSPARRLGWKPTTPLDYGLRATCDWFSRESQLFA